MLQVVFRSAISSVTVLPSADTFAAVTLAGFSSMCLEPYCSLRFSDQVRTA